MLNHTPPANGPPVELSSGRYPKTIPKMLFDRNEVFEPSVELGREPLRDFFQ